MTTYLLSFAAGSLTGLSPCILPVLPIMAGSSMVERRTGPLYLAAGLILSFLFMGLTFTWVTSLFGFSEEQIRFFSAFLLLVFGLSLLSSKLRGALTSPLWFFGNKALQASAQLNGATRTGQFLIGFLMGAAWSPCVGPSLGLALGLVGTQNGLWKGTFMMVAFGVGLSLPLLFIAYGLRKFIQSRGAILRKWNQVGMRWLGVSLASVGGMMILGLDKFLEALILSALPEWFLKISSSL